MSASQKVVIKNAALAPFQAIDATIELVPTDEAFVDQLLLDGGDRANDAGILGREEAHRPEHQQAGVEQLRPVGLREGVELDIEAFVTHLGMNPVPQLCPVGDVGCSGKKWCSCASRTARSKATQAMTFEWVKWRRGPRTSQIPSSGSSQTSSRWRQDGQ